MPYIKQVDRKKLDKKINELITLDSPGELNYTLTKIVHNYIDSKERVNYEVLNETIGVLECCKIEFYRKVVAPYENLKIMQNGDIPLKKK